MKLYSPILLFFTFSFLISCKDSRILKNQNTVADSVSALLNKSLDYNLKDSIRIINSDKAYLLAKKTENDSLIYQSLYIKVQNDIFSGEDSLVENFRTLKFISKNNLRNLAGYFQLKALSNEEKLDSSYFYHQEAKSIYIKIHDSLSAGYNALKLAEIQMSSADYNEVQALATEALSYLKNSKRNDYISNIYTILGLSHIQLQDYNEAIQNFNNAIAFSDSELNKKIIENNIGKVYKETKQYEKAIELLTDLSNNRILDQDIQSKARILDNLGHCLYLNGDASGINQLQKSLVIKDSINDEYGLLASYLHFSEYYSKSNLKASKSYALKAFNLSEKLNNDEDKLEALKWLSKTATTKVKTDSLLSEYIALNEKINVSKQRAKNQFAKIKYDTKEAEEKFLKEKAANAENKLIAEKAKNRTILASAFIIIIILMGFLFFKAIRFRHTQEKQKEIYNTETRISKKVHDELANDVYNAMNFATNQNLATAEKKEILLCTLDSIYNRTRDISRENSPIDLGENYQAHLKEMLSEYQSEFLNVMIFESEPINWNLVDENKKTVVFRVMQELMINMKKHSQASLTVIKFDVLNKNISINYSDNGIGIGNGKTFFKNGLQNVENRIRGINGTITFDKKTTKGLTILISFPS